MKRILGNLREIIVEINSVLSVIDNTIVIAKNMVTHFGTLVCAIMFTYSIIISKF